MKSTSTRTTLLGALLGGVLTVAAASASMPAPAALMPSALYPAIGVAVGVGGPVGVDLFYHDLAPHGYWLQRPNYGWVWTPRVAASWRPYTAGHWVYTDYGWTWMSDESFGWATYHYGRWYEDPDYGWSWVPGTEWGPSWVSWQQGGGYLGWAPLPPSVGWNANAGLALGGVDLSVGLSPAAYCFVPERSFLYGHVGSYVVPVGRNVGLFRETRNITNYGVVNGRVFNRSLDVRRVAQFTGRPVHEYRVGSLSGNERMGRIHGNEVAMFHPSVVRRAGGPEPPQIAPHSVANGRVAEHLAEQHHAYARAAVAGAAVGVAAGVAAHHVAQAHAARVEHERAAAHVEHERVASQVHHNEVAGAQAAAHARAQHNQAVAAHRESVGAHGPVHQPQVHHEVVQPQHARGVEEHRASTGAVHPQGATVHHEPPPHAGGSHVASTSHAGPAQHATPHPPQHAGGHKPPPSR